MRALHTPTFTWGNRHMLLTSMQVPSNPLAIMLPHALPTPTWVHHTLLTPTRTHRIPCILPTPTCVHSPGTLLTPTWAHRVYRTLLMPTWGHRVYRTFLMPIWARKAYHTLPMWVHKVRCTLLALWQQCLPFTLTTRLLISTPLLLTLNILDPVLMPDIWYLLSTTTSQDLFGNHPQP